VGPRPPAAAAPAAAGAAPAPVLPAYPAVSMALTLLFCGYVLIWYLQIGYRMPILGTLRFEFLYAGALIAIVIARGPSMGSPLTGFFVALLLAIAIQVPLSQYYPISSKIFVDRVLKFAAMALFIASFVKAPRHLAFFHGAFLLACLKMGQEGLLGRLTGGLIWENQGTMRLHGPTPIYEHPNSFAGMALGTLPYIFYFFPLANRWIKIMLAALAVCSLNIVIFTGSRTGYIALAAFVALVVLKSQRKLRAVGILVLVLALATPLVPQQYLDRFGTVFTGKDKVGQSTDMRKEILRDAWEVFLEYPLGVGVAAFPFVRWQKFRRIQDTHNLYLEVATNLGVQGFVAFILFVGAQLFLLRRLAGQFASHRARILARAGPGGPDETVQQEVRDLRFMEAVAHATQVFLWVRLALGLFGMDLYEIYWWFAMGQTIALYKMEKIAAARAQVLAPAESPTRAAQPRLPLPARRPLPAMGGQFDR
jgi:O-antigen ligase